MGLDNGIIAIIKEKELPEDFPSVLDKFDLDNLNQNGVLSVAYWRKCWNIRNAIIEKLHLKDGGDSNLDIEDIQAIINILKKFINPKYWEDNNDCIWEYDEMLEANLEIILNLVWLKNYKIKNPSVKVYFYDSY